MAWGENTYGQLGDGGTAASDVPVHVCAVGETTSPCAKPLQDVVAISAGFGFAMALLKDGTVVAWGRNEEGELGDGDTRTQACRCRLPGLRT